METLCLVSFLIVFQWTYFSFSLFFSLMQNVCLDYSFSFKPHFYSTQIQIFSLFLLSSVGFPSFINGSTWFLDSYWDLPPPWRLLRWSSTAQVLCLSWGELSYRAFFTLLRSQHWCLNKSFYSYLCLLQRDTSFWGLEGHSEESFSTWAIIHIPRFWS